MKRGKTIRFAWVLPAFALAALSAGAVSAHGPIFSGRGNSAEATARMFEEQAAMLGISLEEMKDAWADGKGFREIAKDHGIPDEELHQRMVDARKQRQLEHLAFLVEQGVISQEQADRRLSATEDRAGEIMPEGHGKRPHRGLHGFSLRGAW